MRRPSPPRFKVRLAGACAAALIWLAVASCGESPDPVGPMSPALDGSTGAAAASDYVPSTAARTDVLISFPTARVLQFLSPPTLTEPRSASKLIRANKGGFVELNGFRVDLPKGALAEDTVITLDLPTSLPEAIYVVADFGPHGLAFAKPVKLTFPLAGVDLEGIDLETVKIWHLDGGRWRAPGGGIEGGSIVRRTDHFSKYGARGIDTTSGG